MSLKDVFSVLYYGVFASFCGGWVPVRALNIKLIVFHLYVFLSLLLLPLLIRLVNGNHPVGWIVYSVFTGASFVFLKVLNYRFHQALGSDPIDTSSNNSSTSDDNSDHSAHKEDPVNADSVVEPVNSDTLPVDNGPVPVNVEFVTVDDDPVPVDNDPVPVDDDPVPVNKDLVPVEEVGDSNSCSHRSASSLNDATTRSDSLSQTSPPIALSTISNKDTADVGGDFTQVNGNSDKEEEDESPVIEKVHSNSTRERLCQRMSRNDSSSSSSRYDTTLVTTINLEDTVKEQAKHKLMEDNHLPLATVLDKMDPKVHEAIVSGTLSDDNYASLEQRVLELHSGTLALHEADESPGAIHWFEESGYWDFYSFNNTNLDIPLRLADYDEDDFLRRQLENDHSPRNPHSIFMYSGDPSTDNSTSVALQSSVQPTSANNESPPPIANMMILPFVSFTKVELKFSRTQLEDYLDRNVSIPEVILTIVLAVLVCIIGSLLFTLTNFYTDFWIFWLCFVIGTAHFSLVKSVQSDPASPSPGQNRVNAIGRALYFIFIGSLGLIVDAVGSSDPVCIYGVNIVNPNIVMFVRNALFIFLLFLPLLFTIGWMPQFDTFLINLLEQIDMHVFGGTASTGLLCSVYALGRSVLSSLLLVPLGYLGMYYLENERKVGVSKSCWSSFTSFKDEYDLADHCTPGGRISLSFFVGGVVSVAYLLSRSTTNYQYLCDLMSYCWNKVTKSKSPYTEDSIDKINRLTMINRLKVDIFVVICVFVLVTILNITSAFCHTEILYYVLVGMATIVGIVNHYLLPHMRKENPCLCFTEPCLKSSEYDKFEVTVAPKVSVIEMLLQILLYIEKNVLYPLVFIVGINLSAVYYKAKFGDIGAAVLLSIVGVKIFRSAFSDLPRQHIVLILSFLFFNFDYRHLSEGLPLNYFFAAIIVSKIHDLYLKTYFMFLYILPSSWSHPFHIMIQPLLVPHCPVIFFQAIVGSIISAPMNPIIASPMFFLSYPRPIKFWEKNYNTKRQDTSNTRLEQTLDGNMRNPNPDHLDSLFYEQLAWSLQRDICGDITLGRWGRVTSGDIFILTNDQLNALVHIIEIGNGFVTFQLRGLEFRGTYCHQREREAITEPLASDDDTCHLPFVLPCKKLCIARWLAWEVVSSSYTLHGYSIAENQAHLVFNAYVYKKAFITYYTRCIIYNLIKSPQLKDIVENDGLKESLVFLATDDAADVDPLFTEMYNVDWQSSANGISRASFVRVFYEFIQVCCRRSSLQIDTSEESFLVTLCFAFSLLGRRMFFTHASSGSGSRGDNFMHGLYRIFIGDARPSSAKDEWIFQCIESIQEIVIPAARIALKVHQDNFTMSEQYESPSGLHEAIADTVANHVITHENDKSWRDAVVLNKPSLLALRYQRAEDNYVNPYKIIRLNSKFVKFRLIKVNRECVRGLWSSQQHELIFLRNNDSERGSIQNHKASLRNMINSSMDLPIGYPIYVSPLQTSFLDQHMSFNKTPMGRITDPLQYTRVLDDAHRLCLPKPAVAPSDTHEREPSDVPPVAQDEDYIDPFADDDDDDDDFWNPIWVGQTVLIKDVDQVFETFNEGWLQWPDKSLLRKATIAHWKHWRPVEGVTSGEVIHEWRPFHIQSTSRSHIDKLIVLVKVSESDNLLLVKEPGIEAVQ